MKKLTSIILSVVLVLSIFVCNIVVPIKTTAASITSFNNATNTSSQANVLIRNGSNPVITGNMIFDAQATGSTIEGITFGTGVGGVATIVVNSPNITIANLNLDNVVMQVNAPNVAIQNVTATNPPSSAPVITVNASNTTISGFSFTEPTNTVGAAITVAAGVTQTAITDSVVVNNAETIKYETSVAAPVADTSKQGVIYSEAPVIPVTTSNSVTEDNVVYNIRKDVSADGTIKAIVYLTGIDIDKDIDVGKAVVGYTLKNLTPTAVTGIVTPGSSSYNVLSPVGAITNNGLIDVAFHRTIGTAPGHPTTVDIGGVPTDVLDLFSVTFSLPVNATVGDVYSIWLSKTSPNTRLIRAVEQLVPGTTNGEIEFVSLPMQYTVSSSYILESVTGVTLSVHMQFLPGFEVKDNRTQSEQGFQIAIQDLSVGGGTETYNIYTGADADPYGTHNGATLTSTVANGNVYEYVLILPDFIPGKQYNITIRGEGYSTVTRAATINTDLTLYVWSNIRNATGANFLAGDIVAAIPGDTESVNNSDFVAIAGQYGKVTTDASMVKYDINRDQKVNLMDIEPLFLNMSAFKTAYGDINTRVDLSPPSINPIIELTSTTSNNICTVTVKLKGITTPFMSGQVVLDYDKSVLSYSSYTNKLSSNTIQLCNNENGKLTLGWIANPFSASEYNVIKPDATGEATLCNISFSALKTSATNISVNSPSWITVADMKDGQILPVRFDIPDLQTNIPVTYIDPISSGGGDSPTIKIGDYIQMGAYYDEPILWRCVDIDENGPLMLADKILTIKPFDAMGNHTYLDGTAQADNTYGYRITHGSNLWGTSNMRSWLNSTATSGNVTWLDGCPPTSTNVYNGLNAYANEKGFLADGNFTQGERSAIKSVAQKSLLNGVDVAKLKVGGVATHAYNYTISEVVQNYDNAYYQNTTDKMFLLDVLQVNKVYQNSMTLGTNYYIGTPTQKAVDNSEYKDSSLAANNNWYYWLRSPDADYLNARGVRSVYNYIVSNEGATNSSLGVRPAFYLSSVDFNAESTGSFTNPYTLVEKSSACDILNSITPANATIGVNVITANVINSTTSITVDVIPSPDAKWKLYSDSSCTNEIEDRVMDLAIGDNIAYINVVAEDSTTSMLYKFVVTRNGILANSVSAKPGEKAKIDFSVVNAKYLNYCEFTVAFSDNALAIDTTDANGDGIYDAIAIGDYKVLSHTPIMVDSEDPSKMRMTIAAQYDTNNGYPTTETLAKLCSINFDVKTSSPARLATIEIVNNNANQTNCYGVDKDSNIINFDNPKEGSINIMPQPITSIEITGSSNITVNKQSETYNVQIIPNYAANKAVIWTVSDTTVASINESGVLTPITNGTVNVIATATDGSGIAGQKIVVITGQKAFLSAITATSGINLNPFMPHIYSYDIYVPQSATSIIIKSNYTSGTLKNNGMIITNNVNKSFALTEATTAIKLDLTQQTNLDASTYTINVIKSANAVINSDIDIYNGGQKLEVIPQAGGQYNVKATYGNNSTNSNSLFYIISLKSNNRLIAMKIIPYTFAPSEVYTFDSVFTLPSSIDCPNLEVKAMLWKDVNNGSPYSIPLSIYR